MLIGKTVVIRLKIRMQQNVNATCVTWKLVKQKLNQFIIKKCMSILKRIKRYPRKIIGQTWMKNTNDAG